jgi:regulator of protease activity HflC (stomatin/prohibitin superfamily)
MTENTENTLWVIGGITGAIVGIILVGAMIWGAAALHAKYAVWSQGKAGQAELAKADWNRQIAIREAKAKEESASLLAGAEIARAKGVAKANQIIGQSLNNNEAYLRYLWIENLANEHNQVIYVPTESNLPILEAGRLNHLKGAAK